MRNIIIDFLNSDTWKIQLTIAIDSVSSKDVEEERVMHSTSDNKNLTPYKDVNEVINELFESLHSRYQGNLETSMDEVILFLIQFNFCIANFIKSILDAVVYILILWTGQSV